MLKQYAKLMTGMLCSANMHTRMNTYSALELLIMVVVDWCGVAGVQMLKAWREVRAQTLCLWFETQDGSTAQEGGARDSVSSRSRFRFVVCFVCFVLFNNLNPDSHAGRASDVV
jgi:hypothetical protein